MGRQRLLKRLSINQLMDLKIDYAFKQLFGNEKNKEITVVFLNAILERSGREQIKDVVFDNIEDGGETREDKESRLDLLVKTDTGNYINVEIQFNNKYDMINRSLYYWAGIYRRGMKRGMSYKQLRPAIAINIMNFEIFRETTAFHTNFHLHEKNLDFRLTDLMELHFIEMPKLMKDWKQDKLNPRDDILARWLLMLGMVDGRNNRVYDDIFQELEAISMEDKRLSDAFENWAMLSWTEEEKVAYEGRLKRILDEEAFVKEQELRKIEAEERGVEKGLKKGREEGLKEGLKKGLEKGREEGLKEGLETGHDQGLELGRLETEQRIAINMLNKGLASEVVQEMTGLSEKELSQIQTELNNKK